MKKNLYSNYSYDQLKKYEKITLGLLIAQTVAQILLIAISVYTTITKGVSFFSFFFIFFLPLLFVAVNNYLNVKKELRERETVKG